MTLTQGRELFIVEQQFLRSYRAPAPGGMVQHGEGVDPLIRRSPPAAPRWLGTCSLRSAWWRSTRLEKSP